MVGRACHVRMICLHSDSPHILSFHLHRKNYDSYVNPVFDSNSGIFDLFLSQPLAEEIMVNLFDAMFLHKAMGDFY